MLRLNKMCNFIELHLTWMKDREFIAMHISYQATNYTVNIVLLVLYQSVHLVV